MRRSARVAANFHDGPEHWRADGGRQGAAVIDVAPDATAVDEFRSQFADLLVKDWIVRFRMGAVAEIRVVHAASEHKQLRIDRRYVASQLLEALERFVGVLIRQRGSAAEPCVRGQRIRIEVLIDHTDYTAG